MKQPIMIIANATQTMPPIPQNLAREAVADIGVATGADSIRGGVT